MRRSWPKSWVPLPVKPEARTGRPPPSNIRSPRLRRRIEMGLTIKLAPEFSLDVAEDRSVTLPGITLIPTPENLPHVRKFEVEIVGRSTPFAQEQEVERLTGRLSLGYPKLDYRAGKEVPLRQQMTVTLNRVVLEGKVPEGARFTLTAQVWYLDSDAQGRPNTSTLLKGPIKATSVL